MKIIYAAGALRVSSTKQGLQGDSPEDQKNQILQHANRLSQMLGCKIVIKKWFDFTESASGVLEMQPIQKAIKYCKENEGIIKFFFIKSIDRFTRAGSTIYSLLKMQLTKFGTQLVDTYGIIGTKDVNTMEHLGVEYNWSKYSPTWITELLEAERAKSEVRDILTRMISAEIRYTRLGYWTRNAPPGFISKKIDTEHGKRYILLPQDVESVWFIRMFELRAQGNLSDEEIVEKINYLGFKTRRFNRYDPENKKKIIGYGGENKLTVKKMQIYIQNTIYAGVNTEKWTDGVAIKCKFDGLVSVDLFNKANKGKKLIIVSGGEIKIIKGNPSPWAVKRLRDNPNYPYKQFVLCPKCKNPLLGSASRGKSGNYFGAYHCNRGHYFRVSLKDFDKTIYNFVKDIKFNQEFRTKFRKIMLEEWEKRRIRANTDSITIEEQVLRLKQEKKMIIEKIKTLSSESVIKEFESDVELKDQEIAHAMQQRDSKEGQELDIQTAINYCSYFMEHPGELLLSGIKPLRDAAMFGLLFDEKPTYEDLVNGTPKLSPIFALNDAYEASEKQFVTPVGVEPTITWMKARCPRPLDDGAKKLMYYLTTLTKFKLYFES